EAPGKRCRMASGLPVPVQPSQAAGCPGGCGGWRVLAQRVCLETQEAADARPAPGPDGRPCRVAQARVLVSMTNREPTWDARTRSYASLTLSAAMTSTSAP